MEENNKQQPEQDMQESVNEETKEQGTRFAVPSLCFWQEFIFCIQGISCVRMY